MTRRIVVVGEELRAAIAGLLLARRCAGRLCEVHIHTSRSREAECIVMRPDVHRYHDEVGLELNDIARQARLRPVFAVEGLMAGGDACLPFSAFGQPLAGIEFHQIWLRADSMSAQPDFGEFSPGIALHRAAMQASLEQAMRMPIAFGLSVACEEYSALLLQQSRQVGGHVRETRMDAEVDADLVIDCSAGDTDVPWTANTISISTPRFLPGIEWQHLYNTTKRAVVLAAGSSDWESSRREFNRLVASEMQRIADFEELLSLANPKKTRRRALQRKLEVFAACGRIPMEDYDVFAQQEWLAALWARGIRPSRYDRRAEAIPDSNLTEFTSAIRRQIEAMLHQVASA